MNNQSWFASNKFKCKPYRSTSMSVGQANRL